MPNQNERMDSRIRSMWTAYASSVVSFITTVQKAKTVSLFSTRNDEMRVATGVWDDFVYLT